MVVQINLKLRSPRSGKQRSHGGLAQLRIDLHEMLAAYQATIVCVAPATAPIRPWAPTLSYVPLHPSSFGLVSQKEIDLNLADCLKLCEAVCEHNANHARHHLIDDIRGSNAYGHGKRCGSNHPHHKCGSSYGAKAAKKAKE